MKGFYSKIEAAQVLGISVRRVTDYVSEGKLRRIFSEGKVWVPKADVERFYDSRAQGAVPGRDEFDVVRRDVEKLREEIGIIRLAIGSGAPRAPRTESELLLLRQSCLDLLTKRGWSNRAMSELADEMSSLRDEDIAFLCDLKGVNAWTPLFDLTRKMLLHVEADQEFPGGGLGTLHERLDRAHDRLLGLIEAASYVPIALPQPLAKKLQKALKSSGCATDRFMLAYIRGNAA